MPGQRSSSPDGHFLYVTTSGTPVRRGLAVIAATDLALSSTTTGLRTPPAIAVASAGPAAGLVYVLDGAVSGEHPHVVTFKPRTIGTPEGVIRAAASSPGRGRGTGRA